MGVSVAVHDGIVLAAGSARRVIVTFATAPRRRWLDHILASGSVAIARWLAWETSRPA